MKTLFSVDPWKLIETELHRDDMRLSESLTSLGNAHFGMRGNFEEAYSGDCHHGVYLAGCWFPDKTKSGWRKNGYPEYFGKLINAVNMLEIDVSIDGERVDLFQNEVASFYRELNMEHGLLLRSATVRLSKGDVHIEVERFCSITRKELLAIKYRVRPSFAATVRFTPALDGNVRNLDSNYDETFWDIIAAGHGGGQAYLLSQTKENPFGAPRFLACAAMNAEGAEASAGEGRVWAQKQACVDAMETAECVKLVCVDTSRNHPDAEKLMEHVKSKLNLAMRAGYNALLAEQRGAWRARWDGMDIQIDGDDSIQQGIRYNLFQMYCAYDGEDPRLSIGPKGFTGEKYGGAAHWDTEMFCLPMILSTMGERAAQNLLMYRYLHLENAKRNAEKLGCKGALYPMATFTGEECHNEWEIAFEEIHRNAAIAYAIFYVHQYSGNDQYLETYGLPVLLEICRFWISRVNWNEKKRAYMILGVTGPNEYENNANNNWYTNRMAKFCLEQTASYVRARIGVAKLSKWNSSEREIAKFERVAKRIFLPQDKKAGVFLQQDGFLDKEIKPAASIPEGERPIHQHWSWDRVLRSCFIKQADVLQGLYCLRHLYDMDTIRRNFDFYEPLTVHESSLSACVHAILAANIQQYGKAMALFRRTARLDLDNINNNTEDGLHITSMGGSWLAIAKGFAGIRTLEGCLEFRPRVPLAFQSLSFRIKIQGRELEVRIEQETISVSLHEGAPIMVKMRERWYPLKPGWPIRVALLEDERERA